MPEAIGWGKKVHYMTNSLNKAVLYCRTAAQSQANFENSINAQEVLLREYATKNNLKVLKIYKSVGSGINPENSKRLGEMIQYLEKHDISNLLCTRADRITRNFKNMMIINDWIEGDESRHLHLIQDKLVVNKKATAATSFFWSTHMLFAKHCFESFSKRIKEGLARKRKNRN